MCQLEFFKVIEEEIILIVVDIVDYFNLYFIIVVNKVK